MSIVVRQIEDTFEEYRAKAGGSILLLTYGTVSPDSILDAGIAVFAGLIAASLTLVTIAVGWLSFRPLLGMTLLVLAGAGIAGLIYLGKQKA